MVKGFLVRRNLLRQAKHFANERHSFLTYIHLTGKRSIEKLVSLPKVNIFDRFFSSSKKRE